MAEVRNEARRETRQDEESSDRFMLKTIGYAALLSCLVLAFAFALNLMIDALAK